MKVKSLVLISVFCISLLLPFAVTATMDAPVSGVFCGGAVYPGSQEVVDDLRSSGFNTVLLWSFHIHPQGDIVYNNVLIVQNGSYVGDPTWPKYLATLKKAPTTVNRVEVSIGGWECKDFDNIKDLIASQGTGPDSILYKNFKVLKSLTGADAVDYDDETCYDVDSMATFGKMCDTLGYKVTLCPYLDMDFWRALKDKMGSIVDRCYLQCYAGGAGNDPGDWQNKMDMKVIPGLWYKNDAGDVMYTPPQVQAQMTQWYQAYGIAGGFMWIYDSFARTELVRQFASAINNSFQEMTPQVTPQPLKMWIKKPNVAMYDKADWSQEVMRKSGLTLGEAMKIGAEDSRVTFFFFMRKSMSLPKHGYFKPGDAVFFAGTPWYGSASQADAYEKIIPKSK